MNKVVGCFLFIAILCLLLVVGGYVVMMHTPLPAKALAEVLNQDPNFDVQGISGSASKGFSIDKTHFKSGESEFWFEGLTFKYSGYGDVMAGKIIIHEISMKSGKAVMDFDDLDAGQGVASPFQVDAGEAAKDHDNDTALKRTPAQEIFESGISVFRIDLIEFSNLTIQNLDKSFDLLLEKARIDNIVAEEGVGSMGELVVESNMLSLNTSRLSDPDQNAYYHRKVEAVAHPNIHDNLIKDLRWDGEIALYKDDASRQSHTLFDGALRTESSEDGESVIMEGLTLSNYFKSVSAPEDIRISLTEKGEGDDTKRSATPGSFQIGKKVFVVAPLELQTAQDSSLVGIHESKGVTYSAKIQLLDDLPFIRTDLSSEPEQEPVELLGNLVYGKSEDFSEEEQAEIDRLQALYFQPPEAEKAKEGETDDDAEPATDTDEEEPAADAKEDEPAADAKEDEPADDAEKPAGDAEEATDPEGTE
jgi:hypothetical protein